MKSSIQPYKCNTGHAPEVFIIQMEGVGTVHISDPLQVDVHLTDKQTRTMSIGTMRNSVRMPESTVHQGQPLVTTSAPGQQTGRLLYVTEHESRLHVLVDTSSEVSIIPPSMAEQKNQQDAFGLLAANNSPVVTYGTHSLTLNLGLRRTFRWVFIVANVRKPILGADFLKHYGLVVDMRRRRLLDTITQLSIQGVISSSLSPSPTLLPKSRLTTSRQLWPSFQPLLSQVARIIQ